jgi:hypothetical protein
MNVGEISGSIEEIGPLLKDAKYSAALSIFRDTIFMFVKSPVVPFLSAGVFVIGFGTIPRWHPLMRD